MNRSTLAFAVLGLSLLACDAAEPGGPDSGADAHVRPDAGELSCETSADCAAGVCTYGLCVDGVCTYSAIGCDGGLPPPDCTTSDDCGLDECGRHEICVYGYCGALQRACDDAH